MKKIPMPFIEIAHIFHIYLLAKISQIYKNYLIWWAKYYLCNFNILNNENESMIYKNHKHFKKIRNQGYLCFYQLYW